MRILLRPPLRQTLLVAVAATGAVTIASGVLSLLGLAVIAALISFLAVAGLAMIFCLLNATRTENPLTPRLRQQVEEGRRRAIYDYDTGLFAQWYLMIRLAEECERANRYQHDLSLILIQIDRSVESSECEAKLVDWIRVKKRTTDLSGSLGGGYYLVVLPDTDTAGAGVVLERLRDIALITDAIAACPADGRSADELCAAAERRLAGRANERSRAVDRLRAARSA